MFLSWYATLKQTTTTTTKQEIMFLFLILFGEYLRLQVNVWALLRALACTKGASWFLAVS